MSKYEMRELTEIVGYIQTVVWGFLQPGKLQGTSSISNGFFLFRGFISTDAEFQHD